MRNLGFWVSVVLLLLLGVAGLEGFLNDFDEVEALGQRIHTVAQLSFGITGLAAGIGAILKKSWAGAVALVFAFAAALAAGLAPVVWGDAGIGSGIASAAVAFFLGFLLYLGVRADTPEETASEGRPPEGRPPDGERPASGDDG
jgi:hypothetical protein